MTSADRRKLFVVVVALVALVATAAIGGSGAVFTAQTANPGNSFDAAASFGDFRVMSGAYTGNATDNRTVTGIGFQPDVVIIKGEAAEFGVYRTSTMTGDAAKPVSANGLAANLIQSLDSGGFTVGTDTRVNAVGIQYQWTAMKAKDGVMELGTYTGNGAGSRSISGVGFSPEYVNVFSAAAESPRQKMPGMGNVSYRFDPSTGATDAITSLDADGFTVGANGSTNANGVVHHWVAWNETANQVKTGTYVGNGAFARSITGVGFDPYYMQLRAHDTATLRPAVHRSQSNTSGSMRFDAVGNESNAITGLRTDGFSVGANMDANADTIPYHYVAFRDATGSCSAPGSRAGSVASATHVDQAAPGSSFSSDVTLRVRSANASNRRALVRFNLPALPEGCSVVDAEMSTHATAAAAGRTIEVLRADAFWFAPFTTWNNQPGTVGPAATSASLSSPPGWQVWDVTTQVQAQYSGSNNGFVIRDASESSGTAAEQVYNSDNAASNNPVLLVTFG